jgi:hypothetical protein
MTPAHEIRAAKAGKKAGEKSSVTMHWASYVKQSGIQSKSSQAMPKKHQDAARGIFFAVIGTNINASSGAAYESGFASPSRKKSQKVPALAAQAVDAVLALVTSQIGSSRADAVAKLRQAVHHDAVRRPRHAAVALAIADALICSGCAANVQQAEALRRAALALLEPYVSTADERGVLTSLARAGMDRVPPLDEGPMAAALRS